MFDSLTNLPLAQRWHEQRFPGPIVGALIHRLAGDATPRYLLIKRKSNPYSGQWALVGGKWDFGETLAAAVTREVKEETGLDTTFVALRGLINERLAPLAGEGTGAHFLIFVCELSAPDGEAEEQAEGAVAWFTREQIDQLHHAGAIIPSDYTMIQRFAGSAEAIPYFEVEMLTVLDADEHPTQLVRFEQITSW